MKLSRRRFLQATGLGTIALGLGWRGATPVAAAPIAAPVPVAAIVRPPRFLAEIIATNYHEQVARFRVVGYKGTERTVLYDYTLRPAEIVTIQPFLLGNLFETVGIEPVLNGDQPVYVPETSFAWVDHDGSILRDNTSGYWDYADGRTTWQHRVTTKMPA